MSTVAAAQFAVPMMVSVAIERLAVTGERYRGRGRKSDMGEGTAESAERMIRPKEVFGRSNMPSHWERLTNVAPKSEPNDPTRV